MTTTEPQTLAAFVAKHGLTHTVETTSPTVAEMENWPHGANHYKVTIRYGKKRMTVRFHQGLGIKHDPTLTGVLDCLASDAAGFENAGTFEEWANEYGYDISDDAPHGDVKKTARTFKAVRHQSQKLAKFLGDEVYGELLWSTGRE